MAEFKSKDEISQDKVADFNDILDTSTLSTSLEVNVMAIKKLFEDDDTMITRSIVNNHDNSLQYCIAYCNGMINPIIINENIIKPLILSTAKISKKNLLDSLINQVILVSEIRKIDNMKDVIEHITYGDTVLFIDKIDKALILNTQGFETREVREPDSEKTLSGPKEGFTESLLLNLSLIHRKLRTNELKMRYVKIGKTTNTMLCICYIDNIVNKKILTELYSRLDKINVDGIVDSNYITELIKDSPSSLFETTGYTEKPDVVVGKLLEGRIAVLVDGTPMVMTVPYLFIENFQSGEDYYLNYYYATFAKLLRIIGFIITVSIPAFYIAVEAFHHEMFPTQLLINIAMERQSVPLPAALEAIVMLVIFDILRETGVRMPSYIGQALSIVGAIVIGQAAVEAKIIAAPMIIMVATTGITSLLVSKMRTSMIYVRFGLLFLASTLGLYGILLGFSILLIHLLGLRSFGIPQIIASGTLKYQDVKDIAVRAPWWQMTKRPKFLTDNKTRMKKGGSS